jgi:hypothetical protein
MTSRASDHDASEHKTARLQGYYFSQEFRTKNLGDALGAVVVNALGYHFVSADEGATDVCNPGRCLLPIGSTLDSSFIRPRLKRGSQKLDFWGCGWRGNWLDDELLETACIHAVRGPITHRRFHLDADIPLGDPGLLLPWLCDVPANDHGRPIIIPHFRRTYNLSAAERCHRTGCDLLVSTQVQFQDNPRVQRKVRSHLEALYGRALLSIETPTLEDAVAQIAGASFVLTGSLHGAILAQAYGVPWAAYFDGYVDTLPKWYDFAAYLGIDLDFVRTLAEGERWWAIYGRKGKVRDLRPLLAAFPHDIHSEVGQRLLGQTQPLLIPG